MPSENGKFFGGHFSIFHIPEQLYNQQKIGYTVDIET